MRTFVLFFFLFLLAAMVASIFGQGPKMVTKIESNRRLIDDVVAHRDTSSGDMRLEFANDANVSLGYVAGLRDDVRALEDGEMVTAVYLQRRTGLVSHNDTTWITPTTYTVESLNCTRPVP